MESKQCLMQGIAALNLSISEAVQAQLLSYLHLLNKWNKAYNLTAIRDIDEMVVKHLLDSLAVIPYIKGQNGLDVGTGAGLPGLILAITHPQQHWVLLDSNNKKTRFLQQAVIELQLKNVDVVCSRVEQFKPTVLFDNVISRAYSELQKFYVQTHTFLAPAGQLIAMKGIYPVDELESLTIKTGDCQSISLSIPFLHAERHLIIFSAKTT